MKNGLEKQLKPEIEGLSSIINNFNNIFIELLSKEKNNFINKVVHEIYINLEEKIIVSKWKDKEYYDFRYYKDYKEMYSAVFMIKNNKVIITAVYNFTFNLDISETEYSDLVYKN